jgi:hypothetical protein
MIDKVKMRGIIVLLGVVAIACGGKESVVNKDGVLTREKMVAVLTEVYLAEEKTNRLGLSRDSAEKVFDLLQVKVFDKTGVPDSVFRKSVNFYLERPKELEEIYTALVDSLNLKEQRANINHTKPAVE